MRIILTVLLNLILAQLLVAQNNVSVFNHGKYSDFEDIFTREDTFTIKGKLPFENRDFIEFTKTDMHSQQQTLVVECEADGSFEKTFSLQGGQILLFAHRELYFFTIQNKDTLELYQHTSDGSLQIIQKDAQPMRDMERKIQKYNDQYGQEANQIYQPKYKDADHKVIVEKFFNELVQYIYEVRDSSVRHERIDDLIDDEYWRLNSLLIMAQKSIGFIEYHEDTRQKIDEKSKLYLGKLPMLQLVQPRTLSQKKGKVPPTYDDKFYSSGQYRDFLNVLMDYSVLLADSPPVLAYRTSSAGPMMQSLYRLVGQFGYSGFITENMVYSFIVRTAKRFSAEDLFNAYNFGEAFIKSPYLKSKLSAFKSFYERLNKGEEAPYFEFEDRDGKLVTLADFRGKVVYLDFWGVHCGPCIAENEVAPEIYTHYAGENVVFLNVCVDVDRGKWKAQLQEKRPNVIDLYAVGKMRNEYIKAYNISGIPHYFIIDQKGKIHNNHAPRPSQLRRNFKNNDLSSLLDIR